MESLQSLNSSRISATTILSLLYGAALLGTGITFVGLSTKYTDAGRAEFNSDKPINKNIKDACYTAYSKDQSHVHAWLYYTYLFIPFFIWFFHTTFWCRKSGNLSTQGRCKIHIHYSYFLQLVLLIMVHLLSITVFLAKQKDLTIISDYKCKHDNSTTTFRSGTAGKRSCLAFAYLVVSIFLTIFLVAELLYYSYKWEQLTDKVESQSSEKCWKCQLFEKKFGSGMLLFCEI